MKIKTMRERLLASSMICGVAMAAFSATAAYAQTEEEVAEVVVTGSRIQVPGLQSASPITTVGADEIRLQQASEIEQVIRFLPASVPGDNPARNNGTAGVSTVNLRGMGPQRNLIMVDGKRVTPYDVNGRVDVSVIPTAMLDRVDVITGGASAVYGSDAISGMINFILKKDFEGVEFDTGYTQTGEGDGKTYRAALTVGANVADGRGNVALNMGYSKREPVLLGDRPFGQVGVVTATGGGLGVTAPPAPTNCGGPGSVPTTFGGSTTTVPTRLAIAGGPGLGQIRDDGTLGANCSVFNFNPFNYYQTPSERYSATAVGHYEITDNVEAYARAMFTHTNVVQQVAPSGVFGSSFFVPLSNPFLYNGNPLNNARDSIIAAAETGRLAGTVRKAGPGTVNWRDLNGNNVVDAADDLNLTIRRRTGELGPRSTAYENTNYQMLFGLRGDNAFGIEDWSWDASFQRGESTRTSTSAGYTNLANFQNAVNTVDGVTCRTGGDACVPIDIFGAYGRASAAAIAYASATALQHDTYVQQIFSATVGGPVEMIKSPWATIPLAVNFGTEYREETGESEPDECLKLAPASCLGGAGGNTLPIKGGYSVKEVFGEAIVPIFADQPFAKSFDLELGYRYSDYDPSGVNKTWKYGFNWEVVDGFRVRVMQQRAARAPNVGELAAPLVTGLRNANFDPCSVGNPAPISAALAALCISTGMTSGEVGTVQDIVSGQVGTFEGTNLSRLPEPETADTTTVGFVWQPSFLPALRSPSISMDYYKIDIQDVIGIFAPQEILDACYVRAEALACADIVRVNGDIASPASGIRLFTTNLKDQTAEGVEMNVAFGLDMTTLGFDESLGSLTFQFNANYYLKNESQSSEATPVLDCLGVYGTSCGSPTHEFRFIQRTSWTVGDLQLSYLWRYVDEVAIEEVQLPTTFAPFQKIEAYHWLDLTASYTLNDAVRITAGVQNVFEKEAPIVGNEAGTTSANSGNTFPGDYDTLGRVFTLGLNLRF
ncbi:TonB-dependent receptor domain-containing protein [Phenylobacterium sp.]|uniref:TonB-dependent receptor domain-containing protein n=1 Tax=Phenylobacterium sp. TaxID=1871053 RepID=UPI0027362C7A|nr:TonB-dependent receptor [Phenylobacterium sp.]MDP3853704.1 TonB-dependent receptor [Phenylobacterium sp.]